MVKKFKNIFYIESLLILACRPNEDADPNKFKYSGHG